MSDVRVPFGDNPADTATLLLGAAEDDDQDPGVVRTTGDGAFIVDEALAKKAGVDYDKPEGAEDEADEAESKKPAAKKSSK